MRRRLVVYFPLADPAVPAELLDLYADAGVDVVECGWPARNPYLDGPDVRASMARALSGAPARRSRPPATGSRAQAGPKALVMSYAEPDHPALVDHGFFDRIDGVLVVAPPNDERRAAIEREARRSGAAVSVFVPLPPIRTTRPQRGARTAMSCCRPRPGSPDRGRRSIPQTRNASRVCALPASPRRSFSALAFQTASRRAPRSALALTASSSARPRCARRWRDGLSSRRCLKDLRRGLDG